MKQVASQYIGSGAASIDDVYLNAGLIVGNAVDLIRIIQAADIMAAKDDQAVLTDFMFRNHNLIVLD